MSIARIGKKKLAALGGKMPFSSIPRSSKVPWKTCRTCHREGTRSLLKCSTHAVEAIGECGQCGKRRPLVTCHSYDFRRSSITASRKARKSNPKKKASNFKRQYHSKERVEFIASLPCAACGVVGFSENAHLTPVGEKGTGLKGGYRFIAPLCRDRLYEGRGVFLFGCHTLRDRYRETFDTRFPDFNSEQAARQTEIAYQNHLKGESDNAEV